MPLPRGRRRARYGRDHQALRGLLVAQHIQGRSRCGLCGEVMTEPAELLDLAHRDSGGYAGLAHRKCNRGRAVADKRAANLGDPPATPRTKW